MHERELAVAREAAHLASTYLRQAYDRFQVIPDAPASITTDADRQSQEIILQTIRQAFPADALCAEEATVTLQAAPHQGARLWIVDPIDGTRGFARKNGEFSVMIGFVENGAIAVGVVAQPAVHRVTYAVKGQGCWRRDEAEEAPTRCEVTTVDSLRRCTLTQSRSRDPGRQSKWCAALQPARTVESYSAGIKLALIARGEADIYLNTYEAFRDWDICAGHILVTEAGGMVTGTSGQALEYGTPEAYQRHGLLATNGALHPQALDVISGAG
jgi:3'(2'), 5'-bisphosphate nucleotidase